MTQFYVRDRQREPRDAQLPAMSRIYLYPEARRLFPALASQTLASLERQVLSSGHVMDASTELTGPTSRAGTMG